MVNVTVMLASTKCTVALLNIVPLGLRIVGENSKEVSTIVRSNPHRKKNPKRLDN
jgi:hypothetical protein